MQKIVALLAAGAFALSTAAIAQTTAPAKPAAPAAAPAAPAAAPAAPAAAAAKLEKPAAVAQADWDKMSDADKKKAIEKAKADATKAAADKAKK